MTKQHKICNPVFIVSVITCNPSSFISLECHFYFLQCIVVAYIYYLIFHPCYLHVYFSRKQLLGLKETFDLPDSLISCDTPSHLEQLNPDRIRFSWRGLCSTELTDLFVNTCKDINGLVEQLDRLELEADITFPHI